MKSKESSDDIVYAFVQDKNGQILSHTFKSGFPVRTERRQPGAPGRDHSTFNCWISVRGYDRKSGFTILPSRSPSVKSVWGRCAWVSPRSKPTPRFAGSSSSSSGFRPGAGLVAVVLGTLYARTVTRRLDILRKSAEEMIKGNLEVQTGPVLTQGNCWDIKECQQAQCPAYGDTHHRCWTLPGTLCPECAPGGYQEKIETCKDCEIFQEIRGMKFKAWPRPLTSWPCL